ncbi:MAG: type IV conjugative transfer system protein TraE [Pseudomonadota bacterium]
MELSLAHEASQRTLKQRNLLAIISVVLGILVVVMFVAALTRDREIVLQPILPSEMALSSAAVTPEYLEAVTRDTAQLALNRTPETLQYWMDGLVAIAAPEARGALKADLMEIMREQQDSQVTQFVTIDWIRTDPESLTSQVGGVLHTVVGSRDVRREHKIFEFQWKYTGVSLRLKGFGVVVKEGEEE